MQGQSTKTISHHWIHPVSVYQWHKLLFYLWCLIAEAISISNIWGRCMWSYRQPCILQQYIKHLLNCMLFESIWLHGASFGDIGWINISRHLIGEHRCFAFCHLRIVLKHLLSFVLLIFNLLDFKFQLEFPAFSKKTILGTLWEVGTLGIWRTNWLTNWLIERVYWD